MIIVVISIILPSSPIGRRAGVVGRVLASHQCDPGSIPRLGVICGLSLLVFYSAPRGFSAGIQVFLLLQKQHLIWCTAPWCESVVSCLPHESCSFLFGCLYATRGSILNMRANLTFDRGSSNSYFLFRL